MTKLGRNGHNDEMKTKYLLGREDLNPFCSPLTYAQNLTKIKNFNQK